MYIIGLTGGIGVGKSTFSNFFKKKGIPVYNCDLWSKFLMERINYIKINIIKIFGKESYKDSGYLNTKHISKIIFNNPFLLKILTSLVCPWMILHFKKWFYFNKSKYFYCINENAILFETGFYKYCDLIITIIRPIYDRLKSIIEFRKIKECLFFFFLIIKYLIIKKL